MAPIMHAGTADALLFDLGRVVIDVDFDRVLAHWARCAGCEPARLRERFVLGADFKRHETGALSDAAYFASLRGSLGIDIADAEWLAGWNAIFIGEMPGIAGLLGRAAGKLPLYAFSNTNPAHEAVWSVRFAEVLGHFREVHVSSRIGLRKPDAAAYAHVVAAMGVPAERIVFFDDNAENVAGARGSGLQAVQVTSSADVARVLDELGL